MPRPSDHPFVLPYEGEDFYLGCMKSTIIFAERGPFAGQLCEPVFGIFYLQFHIVTFILNVATKRFSDSAALLECDNATFLSALSALLEAYSSSPHSVEINYFSFS